MNLLEVNEATFAYKPGEDIFSQISFNVQKGEIFCLLGPNGCGKSTLLDCVLGLLQPREGRIILDDMNVIGASASQLARKVAYVPQSHEKTFPYLVSDIILMGRASHISFWDSPSSEDKELVNEAMLQVGIYHLRNRPYIQLSGGESQLVMLARALAQKTPLIVMDEPTAHLDFKNELLILETMVNLVKEAGISILMATHFPNHAFYFENHQVQTRVALMVDRGFIETGTPGLVISESILEKVYQVETHLVDYKLGDNKWRQVIPLRTTGLAETKTKEARNK